MARKPKPPSKGPSNAYLISFGDTMTALLAFFIVLNSLAEEQTGANLYSGTGSFVRTGANFGLPGNLAGNSQRRAISMTAPSPLYVVSESEDDMGKQALGPDDNDDALRVIDRERENFERFVNKLNELADVDESPDTTGEVVFDYFNPLNEQQPRLSKEYRSALGQIIPRLHDEKYRVEIVVWAGTPHPNAWKRSAIQASEVGKELAAMGRLTPQQLKRLTVVGKPWIDSVARRPVITAIVTKN